ncbi:hypothetical protein JCM10450v2_007478 [Rhodotorula kratochvilovae]
MPRRRHYDPVFDSDGSPTSSLYASPPSTRRSASPLPPPRRPSPHTFISEPPRLHVRETLSADAATRLMLEKWDLMDSLAAREADDPRGRRERRKSRASSMPSGPRRRVSRVREYEMWQPERERIRLAQVEMERRADEEKEEAQFVEAELVVKEAVAVKKVRDRKATPALVISRPVSDNEDEDDWRSTGKSPSPPTDDDRPAATDLLLGAAADAVEQVGEAVSSALSRVGALFSAGRTSGN